MNKQNGQRLRSPALLMNEVDPQTVNVRAIVGKLVKFFFLTSPVKVMLPLVYKGLQIAQIGTIIPSCIFHLVRPAGAGQAIFQIRENSLRDMDGERVLFHSDFFLDKYW